MIRFLFAALSFQDAASAAAPPATSVRQAPLVSFSELGDAAGHTGRAVVEATLGVDGKFRDAEIRESARSQFLDADALSTVLEAKVGQNPAQPVRIRMTVEFRPTDLLTMRCDTFARQVRWYEAAWPERTQKDTIVYVMALGYETLSRRQAQGLNAALAGVRGFESAFSKTVDRCERSPSARFTTILHDEMRQSS
ncbi:MULTISPECIES: energy transducer TonB family protein [Brevundimonas]|jgi:TonB family protein|uniref:TonB C-terminal domain-containing protein n=1 Tax=Brevundimonas mediterranea TaxID=74329 RepID=A0A7Z8Y512_9CAUL|nr:MULTISPECIES: energy transducer TonB [Brevundimonas]MCG2663166.1 energy transducer TonB [Brevundimonas sp.]VDC51066.1 hypothetical protein BREV_BREV_02495 [Brevundimonas mediterranea]